MDTSFRSRRIAVTSDRSLVAEAVRAALSSRGFDAFVLAWTSTGRPVPAPRRPGGLPAEGGLMLCDFEPAGRLREARALARGVDLPWLLLTATAPGPLWGALLDAGVRGVLPSSTTLDAVARALEDLADGRELVDEQTREGYLLEWQEARREKERLRERLGSLSPRERTVLERLYAGESVRMIAEVLEVSEATVRSHVKAVLSKLGVNSQLAAVAAFGCLQNGAEEAEGTAGRIDHGARARRDA
jgi:RNA polymerase sigma factor (sigma-70 family)